MTVTKHAAGDREMVYAIGSGVKRSLKRDETSVDLVGTALMATYTDVWKGDPEISPNELVRRIEDRFASGRIRDWSIFRGISGLGWILAHLRNRGVAAAAGLDITPVDELIIGTLQGADWAGSFDQVHGLVAMGVFGLERSPGSNRVLDHVLEQLLRTADRRLGITSWFSSPRILPPSTLSSYPDGVFDLGIAHGVPGVIAFLARMTDRGYEDARRALEESAQWLWGIRRNEGQYRFSAFMSRDGRQSGGSRLAWCYGDLGIATALWSAGKSLNDKALQDNALILATRCASIPPEKSGVVDIGLCHGSQGVSHLFLRLYLASGNIALKHASDAWWRVTLDQTLPVDSTTGAIPYWDYIPSRSEFGWLQSNSLLTGSIGVALSLNWRLTGEEPTWDRILMADLSAESYQDV